MQTDEGQPGRTPGARSRRRGLLRWAIGAVVGVAAALLIWWLLSPYVWFWKYEDDLDSDDETARFRAIVSVAARLDGRSRDIVDAKLRPWLDGSDDRRFQTAFAILNAYGRLPAAGQRPDLHLRLARILYEQTTGAARASVIEGLESLRGVESPDLLALLGRGLKDEDATVRSQAVWTALRWNGPGAEDILLGALRGDDDKVTGLAATGLLWADRRPGRPWGKCEEALRELMASRRKADVRAAALETWAVRFFRPTPAHATLLLSLAGDRADRVAAAAVEHLHLVKDAEAAHRVSGILGGDAESLLTARAAAVAGPMALNDQAQRLAHWVYHAERADVREAAAAGLGRLDFDGKEAVLATMLANAVLEGGTSLDLAILDAMRDSLRRVRPEKPPQRWLDLLTDVCSKLPTDAPASAPATSPATTRAAVLDQQPMVACEAAILLSEWAPAAARKFLWVQMDSPIVEIRDRAAVALGRVLDGPYGQMLRADLTDFAIRRRCAAALALGAARDEQGLEQIQRLLPRQREHPVAELYFRGALWIGGRDADGAGFGRWVEARDIAPMSRMRIALLAGSREGLELLLTDEHDPRWSVDPEQLDEFLQATRMFELLPGLLADWHTPGLEYDPFADKTWRVAQCRRLGIWYQVHRDRLRAEGGRLKAD